MISGGEIKNILLAVVKDDPLLGMIPEIVKDKHDPVKEGQVKERVVVVIPGGVDNGQFLRSFPRICIYVPDVKWGKTDKTKHYRPDTGRLTALESHCFTKFRSSIYGKYNDEVYLYGIDTITTEEDPETWSHFLNVRLRFEVVKTKL